MDGSGQYELVGEWHMHAGIHIRDIIYFDVWYNGYVQCTVKCVCVQPRDFGTRCILLVCEGSNVRAI